MPKTISKDELESILTIVARSPDGLRLDEIQQQLPQALQLRTLQRRMATLCATGQLIATGSARATRYHYVAATGSTATPSQDQPVASFPSVVPLPIPAASEPVAPKPAIDIPSAEIPTAVVSQGVSQTAAWVPAPPDDSLQAGVIRPTQASAGTEQPWPSHAAGVRKPNSDTTVPPGVRPDTSATLIDSPGSGENASETGPEQEIERPVGKPKALAQVLRARLKNILPPLRWPGKRQVTAPHTTSVARGLVQNLQKTWQDSAPLSLLKIRARHPQAAGSDPLPGSESRRDSEEWPAGHIPQKTNEREEGRSPDTGAKVQAGASSSGADALRPADDAASGTTAEGQPKAGESAHTKRAAAVPVAGLGWWNFYFLAKLLMYWKGFIGFHPLENLAFGAVLLLPLRTRLGWRMRFWLALPVSVGLLYHDSWLPPVARIFAQAGALAKFDLAYLVELLGRFINPHMVALLTLLWVVYWILSQWFRLGLLVMCTLVGLNAVSGHSRPQPEASAESLSATDRSGAPASSATNAAQGPAAQLQAFYAREAQRRATWGPPAPGASAFDIIFIHICSLSWDDVKAVGEDVHPLWKKFDLLFNQFNSAASYSGPAAIRLLRSPCGQETATALYSSAAEECYLMGDLKRFGFDLSLAMNHDGHFEDFLKSVQNQEIGLRPQPLDGVTVAQHAFDDSPIFDDGMVLKRWLELRKQNPAARVALYYNTISLHDGNKMVGNADIDSIKTYKTRLARLLDQVSAFMDELEASNRRTILVFIPEHGAAFRGDKMQIAGLREIPSPTITLVPVGIKVIGAGLNRAGNAMTISEPSSYLALAQVLGGFLQKSPFDGASYLPSDYADGLPVTPFVAENGDTIVMRASSGYLLRQDANSDWTPYDPG